jgi:site-specific DNA-adenine methylase
VKYAAAAAAKEGHVMPLDDVLARAGALITLVRKVQTGTTEEVVRGTPRDRSGRYKGTRLEEAQLVLPEVIAGAAPLEKTIWGSPAGKKRLAARLVKLIPPHEVYVEPFAGSAAVFFEKEPAAAEVLSDGDPEIASAFRAIKSLTNGELESLRRKDWVGRRKTFLALKDTSPRGKVEKLYRFLYLSHFAYGKLRGKSYNPNAEGVEARTMDRLDKFRERLKNVTMRSGHYADVVKEFDGKDTFFFLDPPYPGHDVEVGEDVFDEAEFRKVLDGIKGRFLVTYGTRGQLDTKGFHVRKIRTPRTIRTMHGVEGPKTLPQLLITNYTIAEKTIGVLGDTLRLDDVDVVDLEADLAVDLERVRALTKVVAEERWAPREVHALAKALDRIEPLSNNQSSTLTIDLLALTNRVAPELAVVAPDAAGVMVEASRALEDLVKAQRSRGQIVASFKVEKTEDLESLGVPADSQVAAPSELMTATLAKRIPLLKTGEERFVFGIVLEPETVDAQKDIYSSTEVRDAAHRFMEEYQNIGLMHRGLVNEAVKILESYVAPTEFEVDGTRVKKGTWLLAVRVQDEKLWQQVKAGELGGFSIGGTAIRAP